MSVESPYLLLLLLLFCFLGVSFKVNMKNSRIETESTLLIAVFRVTLWFLAPFGEIYTNLTVSNHRSLMPIMVIT